MTFTGWGATYWGSSAWGGGSGTDVELLSALAIAENVVRLEFSRVVYFSRLLEPADASIPSKYSVTPVSGSEGMDETASRPVSVVRVDRPTEDSDLPVDTGDVGRFLDLVLDRPMTPFPSLYDVTATQVFSEDLVDVLAEATLQIYGVFKRLQEPVVDSATPSRDIANPTGLQALAEADPNPASEAVLGTFRVDDTGDYAADEGITNLKKRVVRRGITRKGGFAHLPTYGVGIPQYGKRLAIASVLAQVAADYEAQLELEPDLARARVIGHVDQTTPGLVKFSVAVQPKSGKPQAFDVPFKLADLAR